LLGGVKARGSGFAALTNDGDCQGMPFSGEELAAIMAESGAARAARETARL